jgi:ankyrin repeat protein
LELKSPRAGKARGLCLAPREKYMRIVLPGLLRVNSNTKENRMRLFTRQNRLIRAAFLFLPLLLTGCASTDLQEAAQSGSTDQVSQLIDKGADKNAQDKYGYTPLHWAAYEGQLATTKLLVERGAKLEIKDNSGATPMLVAAKRGFPDVVKYLLSKGANPDVVDNDGWTALHYAARNGYQEIVRMLIDHNADPNVKTLDTAQTPLGLAREYGRDDVVKALSEKGRKE